MASQTQAGTRGLKWKDRPEMVTEQRDPLLLNGAGMASQSGAHPDTWASALALPCISLPTRGSKTHTLTHMHTHQHTHTDNSTHTHSYSTHTHAPHSLLSWEAPRLLEVLSGSQRNLSRKNRSFEQADCPVSHTPSALSSSPPSLLPESPQACPDSTPLLDQPQRLSVFHPSSPHPPHPPPPSLPHPTSSTSPSPAHPTSHPLSPASRALQGFTSVSKM